MSLSDVQQLQPLSRTLLLARFEALKEVRLLSLLLLLLLVPRPVKTKQQTIYFINQLLNFLICGRCSIPRIVIT